MPTRRGTDQLLDRNWSWLNVFNMSVTEKAMVSFSRGILHLIKFKKYMQFIFFILFFYSFVEEHNSYTWVILLPTRGIRH